MNDFHLDVSPVNNTYSKAVVVSRLPVSVEFKDELKYDQIDNSLLLFFYICKAS